MSHVSIIIPDQIVVIGGVGIGIADLETRLPYDLKNLHAVQIEDGKAEVEYTADDPNEIMAADVFDDLVKHAQGLIDAANAPPPPPTLVELKNIRIAGAKAEAMQRIIAVLPEWKQRNLIARAVELQSLGKSNWNDEQEAEWAAMEAAWAWIKSVRSATDIFETNIKAAKTKTAVEKIEVNWPEELAKAKE